MSKYFGFLLGIVGIMLLVLDFFVATESIIFTFWGYFAIICGLITQYMVINTLSNNVDKLWDDIDELYEKLENSYKIPNYYGDLV